VGCANKDSKPPTAPSNLTNTTPGNDQTPTFNWDAATDRGSGIACYLVRIDDAEWSDIGDSLTHTCDTPLPDGNHTFQVKAVDKAGKQGDAARLALTVDITPPIVSAVSVSGATSSTATIAWTTNEPAISQVQYGATTGYGLSQPASPFIQSSYVVSHSINLSGLTANTTYHCRVRSIDLSGNEATSADSTFATANDATGQLTVHFIDVGQGDAILVDYGTYEVLIDGGSSSPGVVSYLNSYVDGPLEVMVATHPHADHIGGLTAVLGAFQVQQIWSNGEPSTSQTYTNFMSAVQAEGAEAHVARRGDQISVSDLTFKVLNPTNVFGSTNNNSIVLSLSYGQVDFLFEGDAEQEAETSIIAAGLIPDVEILKVGHHASRTASSATFLAAAKPEAAIYMAGTGNGYGHPHAETIAALQAIGATIYGTDVKGDIVVTTDGQTYNVTTEK
jgi:beta-lactamase superfamily II metal-dependent hydrolase